MTLEDSTITVLIVDDQPVFADLVVRLLNRQPDIEVVGRADTVDDALSQVRQHLPDVVLMDHQLPDGRGTEAAKRIVTEFRTVRVVMLTAIADDRTLEAARSAGCSGYVTKDRASRELADAVRAAHRGETVVPASMITYFLERDERDRHR